MGHMDLAEIQWSREDLRAMLQDEFETVIFSGHSTDREDLLRQFLSSLRPPMGITVDSENFLQYFKISDQKLRVLKTITSDAAQFEEKVSSFMTALQAQTREEDETAKIVFDFYRHV